MHTLLVSPLFPPPACKCTKPYIYVHQYYDLGHLDDFAAMLPPLLFYRNNFTLPPYLTVNISSLQEFSNTPPCVTY